MFVKSNAGEPGEAAEEKKIFLRILPGEKNLLRPEFNSPTSARDQPLVNTGWLVVLVMVTSEFYAPIYL